MCLLFIVGILNGTLEALFGGGDDDGDYCSVDKAEATVVDNDLAHVGFSVSCCFGNKPIVDMGEKDTLCRSLHIFKRTNTDSLIKERQYRKIDAAPWNRFLFCFGSQHLGRYGF